jgi:hypothetical protein
MRRGSSRLGAIVCAVTKLLQDQRFLDYVNAR